MSFGKPRDERQSAEVIRKAYLQRALEVYEGARMDGLCHEGAWEMAVSTFNRALQTSLCAEGVEVKVIESLDDLARLIAERNPTL